MAQLWLVIEHNKKQGTLLLHMSNNWGYGPIAQCVGDDLSAEVQQKRYNRQPRQAREWRKSISLIIIPLSGGFLFSMDPFLAFFFFFFA